MSDPLVSTFNCPNCGSPVTIRATGQTLSVTCPACASVIGTENGNYQVLWQYQEAVKVTPLIPLGTRGELEGTKFEVIGFMLRSDEKGEYPWREYLLFNPYEGFRWLVEADGHWSFVTMIKSQPGFSMDNRRLIYENEVYSRFLKGKALTNYVLGEFYWSVKAMDLVDVGDYVAPPHMLSYESNEEEIVWSHALYVEPEIIQKAFNLASGMPVRWSVAPHQPSPWIDTWDNIKWNAVILVLILVLLHLLMCIFKDGHVFAQTYSYAGPSVSSTAVEEQSQPFQLTNKLSAVEVELQAPVSNSWLDADLELVNTKTGETFPVAEEVSYYSGYDSDGFWAEGGQTEKAIIPSVPAGPYLLHADVEAAPNLGPVPFNLIVRDGIAPNSNLYLAAFMILLIPGFVYWRKYAFESARWAESDYTPV